MSELTTTPEAEAALTKLPPYAPIGPTRRSPDHLAMR